MNKECRCPRCKLVKTPEDFPRCKGKPGGRDTYCKPCKGNLQREADAKSYLKADDPTAWDRFWPKVKIRPESEGGCWEWQNSKNIFGYGQFTYKGRMQGAHRASLAMHGIDVPKGMHADHICRNRGCVRPDHMRIVTPRQNCLENNLSPFAINANKKICTKCENPLSGDNIVYIRRGKGTRKQDRCVTRVCLTCCPRARHSKYRVDPPPEMLHQGTSQEGKK